MTVVKKAQYISMDILSSVDCMSTIRDCRIILEIVFFFKEEHKIMMGLLIIML